jgi:hypothetical protein
VAVVPDASAGKLLMRPAVAGDAVTQMAVATRTIDVPTRATARRYNEALGPNEIRNLPIAAGDYVLAALLGRPHLTLIEAHAYHPGELIGWDPAAPRRPASPAPGAWAKYGRGRHRAAVRGPLFRPVNGRSTRAS